MGLQGYTPSELVEILTSDFLRRDTHARGSPIEDAGDFFTTDNVEDALQQCGVLIPPGGAAPDNAEYVVLTLDATLANERVLIAGDGLLLTDGGAGGNVTLDARVDNVTIEVNADILRVKADGINDTHIDWGLGANQVSGVDVPLLDAGGFYAVDNVEAALQEIGAGAIGPFVVPNLTLGTVNAAGVAASMIRSDATILVFDATNPAQLTPDIAAAVGVATVAARRDHVHNVPTAVAGNIAPDDGAAEGVAGTFARSDHVHSNTCAAPGANLSAISTNAEGAAANFSRSDHAHAITNSANPGAAVNMLSSTAEGYLTLVGMGIGAVPGSADLHFATGVGITHVDGVIDGNVLRANGTRYIPDTLDLGDLGDVGASTPTNRYILQGDGALWQSQLPSLPVMFTEWMVNDYGDTLVTNTGEMIYYDHNLDY